MRTKKRAMMAGMLTVGLFAIGGIVMSVKHPEVYADDGSAVTNTVESVADSYKDVTDSDKISLEKTDFDELGESHTLAMNSEEQEVIEEVEVIVVQTGIKLDTTEFKTEYVRNEDVDTSKIKVIAEFSDGTEKVLTTEEYSITQVSTEACGNKSISITNGEFSKEIEIKVWYTTDDIEDYTMYSSTNLNLREGPGTEFNAIGGLKLNDEVKVIERADNGWVKVVHSDKEYFCSEKYLMKEKKVIETPAVSSNYDSSIMHFDGNIPQDRKNKALSLYSKIPQNVLNAVKNDGYTIWVSSSSQYTDGHCGTFYPKGYDYGICNGKIAIYAKSVWAVDIAVIHETGHWMDNYLGRKEGWGYTGYYRYQGVTSDPAWVEIYNAEVGASGYPSWANYCPEEYFAESVWKALASPSWCKKTLPRTYEYVMNCVNRVQ